MKQKKKYSPHLSIKRLVDFAFEFIDTKEGKNTGPVLNSFIQYVQANRPSLAAKKLKKTK